MAPTEKVKIYLFYMEACLFTHEFAKVEAIVDEVRPYLENPLISDNQKYNIVGLLLKYTSLIRDFHTAQKMIADFGMERIDLNDIPRESELVGLAYYYWMSANLDRAKALLEKFIPILEKSNRIEILIEMQTLYSVVLIQLEDLQNALLTLSIAINRGSPDGYFWTFVSFGESIVRLLILLSGPTGKYNVEYVDPVFLHELVSAIVQKNGAGSHGRKRKKPSQLEEFIDREALAVSLTKQEKIILAFITDGYDNKTIARELHVSNNTIKTHITNIFGKLGVHKRTEAIYHARLLKLL
jgi:LuxR family maltose regulon positive regulatory protein